MVFWKCIQLGEKINNLLLKKDIKCNTIILAKFFNFSKIDGGLREMSNRMNNLAEQRITKLLDDNSFMEIGSLVTARSTDFNLGETDTPSDGVITGHGLIDGNLVFVYSQDVSVLNGTIGEMHAKKIAAVYDRAMKMGAPVIGFLDCAGVRLQESVDALDALGMIYEKQVMASGVIPQICAGVGTCGGGLSVFRGVCDFADMG